MWTYISKDGTKYAIPYSNIDYVILSKGLQSPWKKYFDHKEINNYYNSEYLTIIYKKTGGFIYIEGEVAFNQLVITPEHRFTSQKN
jgi:hypothetical protein